MERIVSQIFGTVRKQLVSQIFGTVSCLIGYWKNKSSIKQGGLRQSQSQFKGMSYFIFHAYRIFIFYFYLI